MRRCLLLVFLLSCIALSGCLGGGSPTRTSSNDGQGSGSEIVGRVEQPDTSNGQPKARASLATMGLPAIGAMIYIYPESFVVDPSRDPASYVPSAYTDSSGSFTVSNVPIGTWVVEANDGMGHAVSRRAVISTDGMRVDVGTMILAVPSSLKLTLDMPADTDVAFTIYVEGTRSYAVGDANNLTVELTDIPTGIAHKVRCVVTKPVEWNTTIGPFNFDSGLVEKTIVWPF